MKVTKKIDRKNFAALVVKQLEKHGISCALVGGACLSIYTNERHASHDAIEAALSEIGFEKKGRSFEHPQSKLYVEFPSGPIGIGAESPVKPQGQMKIKGTVVKMLSPSQCVMDRLSAWFHWNDRRSLIHALWVCERHPIHIAKIRTWALAEDQSEKFNQFLLELKKIKKIS